MALMGLPLSAVMRLDDVAIGLHLFEESRRGNVPVGLPHEFHGLQRVPLLLGATFVDALVGAGRLLRRFAAVDGQAGVREAAEQFFAAFPDLFDLRDSIEHEDERLQFRARKKVIPVPSISVAAGESVAIDEKNVFHGRSLANSVFQATVQDGRLAKLEINQSTLSTARRLAQTVFFETGRSGSGYDWPFEQSD
jgi:hypothetical protein